MTQKTQMQHEKKRQTCSLKRALAYMKSAGATEITPDEKRRDPQLRKALRMPRS